MNPADAVAAIESIQKHDLSLSYRWSYGWTCCGRKDFEFMSDAQPRYFYSVIDAVVDWMGRNGHPWPVTVSEAMR